MYNCCEKGRETNLSCEDSIQVHGDKEEAGRSHIQRDNASTIAYSSVCSEAAWSTVRPQVYILEDGTCRRWRSNQLNTEARQFKQQSS